MCAYHDKPQFNFCFDCGSPLVPVRFSDGAYWVCEKNMYHVHIEVEEREHVNPEGDYCEGIQFD
jgi:DNA-directed RNA polymerase subunit M/transcription elongation factor TFIIS